MTINIVCGPSATVTESAYPSTLTDTQVVDVNNLAGTTAFTLPAFIDTNPTCPITNIKIVDTNDASASQSLTVLAPSSLTGTLYSVPVDISLNTDYSFYIVVTSSGGTEYLSSMKQLQVGCSPSLVLTQSASFVPSVTLSVGDSILAAYTFSPPSSNRP